MGTLVIKNFPEHLHAKLKARAISQHRSMTREAIALIEASLEGGENQVKEPRPPYKGKFHLTQTFIDEAKRSGRS